MMRPARLLIALIGIALITACTQKNELEETPPPLGDFSFGYNIVLADKAQKGPLSRNATPEELSAGLKEAVGARMGRYQGDKLYHLGMNVDAYALAIPGSPVVAKPKSVLVVSVSVWDDAAGGKINPEPKQLFVFESFTGSTFIGSGLTQSKEVQLKNLSYNMARKIETWLRENEAWFGPVPNPAEVAAAAKGAVPGAKATIAPSAIAPVGVAVTTDPLQ